MKLNKIPVMTTNSFNLNDIDINLEIPTNFTYKEFDMINDNLFDIKYFVKDNFNSKFLSFDKYLNVDILVKDKINKDLILTCNLDNNLIDNINIKYMENSSANIIIKYNSNIKCFHHLNSSINMLNNSNGNISIINNLNDDSTNLIAINNNLDDNSILNLNLFDLGSNIKINNINSNTNLNATSNLNNIYIGNNNNILDMNYNYINNKANSNNSIKVEGLLNDYAKKNFRGTISFLKNAKDSVGKVYENTILLSDNVINRSVPLLLCNEEEVNGAHGISSGNIDQNKLFYLESKGINIINAKKMICMANFNRIIKNIKNFDVENEIIDIIDKKILIK